MNPDPSNSASTGDDPTVNADAILKALANPVRREILAWLKDPKAYFEERPPYLRAWRLRRPHRRPLRTVPVDGVTHLAVLQRAGLITATKVGQWVFFRRNEA